jgi:hypothetical protein
MYIYIYIYTCIYIGLMKLDRNEDCIPNRLEKAVITGISSGNIGDRVCIDLIQLLKEVYIHTYIHIFIYMHI